MRKITYLWVALFCVASLDSSAQMMMGGGMGGMRGGIGRGGQQMMHQAPLELNLLGATGCFALDQEDVLKAMKLKKNPEAQEQLSAALATYNKAYEQELEVSYREVSSLEFAQGDIDAAEADRDLIRQIMMSQMGTIRALLMKMLPIHDTLNEQIAAALDEKELDRWTKYYTSLCEKKTFRPNGPERRGGDREGAEARKSGARPQQGGRPAPEGESAE